MWRTYVRNLLVVSFLIFLLTVAITRSPRYWWLAIVCTALIMLPDLVRAIRKDETFEL
ncbi:hypothetical protein SAMN02910418_00096 [Bowdeniella nasicola]|uniref:Uncharacterized protein n=1 Tax=Bowdeniella nasicola TaxID=208480 RepID=A0A1H3VKS6_9ACTO|nr:hypothetical protein SAMN02910418_00096 [Bowdeniella nasicola]